MPSPRRPLAVSPRPSRCWACVSRVQHRPRPGTGLRLGAAGRRDPTPAGARLPRLHRPAAPTRRAGAERAQGQGAVRLRRRCRVPLDYRRPDGPTITLALVRIHDTENTTRPVAVAAGQSRRARRRRRQLRARAVRRASGRGRSRTTTSSGSTRAASGGRHRCTASPTPEGRASSRRRRTRRPPPGCAEAKRLSRQFVARLRAQRTARPALLQHRQHRPRHGPDPAGRRRRRMNYLGFSYGTELGWTYAHLFPKQVRTFVLDGAVDPTPIRQRALGRPARRASRAPSTSSPQWCGTRAVLRGLRQPARGAVERIVAGDATHRRCRPAPARTLTASLAVHRRARGAVLASRSGRTLGHALLAAARGDGAGLLAPRRPVQPALSRRHLHQHPRREHDDQLQRLAAPRPPTDAQIRATRDGAGPARYPMFGAVAGGGAVLLPAAGSRTAPRCRRRRAATPKPVLVVGNLHDPATPYQGAVHLTTTLGNARAAQLGRRGPHVLPAGQLLHRPLRQRLPDPRHAAARPTRCVPRNDRPMTDQPKLLVADADRPGARHRARAARRAVAAATVPVRATNSPCCACARSSPSLRRARRRPAWPSRRCATGCAGGTAPSASPVPDTLWALDQLAARFPDVPVALVGHSMGGRAAMYAAGARQRCARSSGSRRGSSRATRSPRWPAGGCSSCTATATG